MKGEVTSPFRHAKRICLPKQKPKCLAFQGLDLVAAFDSKVVLTFDLDHKKALVVHVKVEKLPTLSMEIYGTKEVDFDFDKSESSSKDEGTMLALVHYPPWPLLKREAKNVEFTDGSSDSTHSLDVGDVFKELEEVSNKSSSSKLQEGQDDSNKAKSFLSNSYRSFY